MRYVITGGLGFIGSHFVRNLLQEELSDEVVNIDCVTYAADLSLNDEFSKSENYKFLYANLANASSIKNIIQDDDIIVNFAAESHVDRSIHDGTAFLQTNVVGTYNLLKECQHKKIKKIVHISTDEVYGSLSFEDRPKVESDIFNPSSLYSASKASAEMICMAMFHTFEMPIVITRSSNNYGTHQYPEKMIPYFVKKLIEGKNVPLYGDGKNVRDWLHVADNCDAIRIIVDRGRVGEAYNIGGCNQISNIDVTRKMLSILNLDESRIDFVQDRLGHDRRYDLNCDKTKALGWLPVRKFDEEFPKIVQWYKNKMKGIR